MTTEIKSLIGAVWITDVDPTVGVGVVAPLSQFLISSDAKALYYKSGPADTAWTQLSGASGWQDDGTVVRLTTPTDEVVIGAAAAAISGQRLAVVGNGNQIALENQTLPVPATLLIANSGDTIWDISPVPINSTDAQEVRLFRRTSTSGPANLTLLSPNTSSAVIKLSPSGTQLAGLSFFAKPVAFGSTSVPNKYPIAVRQTSGPGQTSENSIARFDTGSPALQYSFDTTAGAIECFGIHINNNTQKSAGTNPLTVVGLYATAGGGDVNLSARLDGDVAVIGDIDMSGGLRQGGTQVVGAQGAAIADAAGGSVIDVEARNGLNTLLARLRATTGHGLIA